MLGKLKKKVISIFLTEISVENLHSTSKTMLIINFKRIDKTMFNIVFEEFNDPNQFFENNGCLISILNIEF